MQELLFAWFLSREECSLCIVAHRVQKCFLDARIAADFGLRSFEVLGFGRATRLVSAMPVLTSAFGAQNVWASNQRALWFLVWCNLLVLPQVEFWRQREGIPALDVFKQASSANERRRRRRRKIPHQALRAQDVLESSRNSSPLPSGLCQPRSVL